jgi:hypothetical protein
MISAAPSPPVTVRSPPRLHADVAVLVRRRDRLEHLVRYVLHPPRLRESAGWQRASLAESTTTPPASVRWLLTRDPGPAESFGRESEGQGRRTLEPPML